MRTAGFVVLSAVLAVAAVLRLGPWAGASPASPQVATTTTTAVPSFIGGVVIRAKPTSTTTTVKVKPLPPPPNRNWSWDQLAQCEAGGRWDAVRGIYQGGLQFDARTWDHYAPGFGYPADAQSATREQQIAVAEIVLRDQGVHAWPTCGPRIGMTGVPRPGAPSLPSSGPPDDVPD